MSDTKELVNITSKIFYHGSNKLFDKFDTKYSHSGEIFVSPCHCKLNSMS